MTTASPGDVERFPVTDGTVSRVPIEANFALRVIDRRPESPDSAFPPIVLLHGLASNARMWDGVAAELARHGARTLAVDLRGHGLSDRPEHGYDFASIGRDVCGVLDGFDIERSVVVGQSWGGNVVVDLAHRHADRVIGVVAVDGGMIDLSRSFPEWDECARVLRPPTIAGTRAGRLEAAIRSMHVDWPETGIIGALSNFEVLEDGTVRPWLSLDRHMAILRALWEHRPSELYARIDRPVLFLPADSGDVAWTDDKDRAVEEALRRLAKGRVHWFRPAHHDVHAQHPTEVADVIMANLRDGFLS